MQFLYLKVQTIGGHNHDIDVVNTNDFYYKYDAQGILDKCKNMPTDFLNLLKNWLNECKAGDLLDAGEFHLFCFNEGYWLHKNYEDYEYELTKFTD